MQEVKRGSRVLVAAASNIAVDNIVERLKLAAPKLKAVRMGHPARLMPEVHAFARRALRGRTPSRRPAWSTLVAHCRPCPAAGVERQPGSPGPEQRQ